ncbi:hypothetical protein CC80DRAFT_550344 [Byssothecium circinans]|uniref:Uncharacterized protein n=1 Tax=Byssothecium circinans TaxID=147558 RepID=A0A6A5TRH9_9PLEO|nr:hypothetical protein CC80DRAFT_550344 [Byssothecium circinans]
MLQHLRTVFAIFNFLNDPSREMPDAANIAAFADGVIEDYFPTVERDVTTWVIDQINYAEHIFGTGRDANGNRSNSYTAVIAALSSYRSKIQNLRLPRGKNGGGI